MPEVMTYKRFRTIKREGLETALFNVYGVVMKCDQKQSVDAVGRTQDEYRLILNDGELMHVTIYTAPDHFPAGTIAIGKIIRLHRLKLAIFNVPELSGEKYLRGRIGGVTSILVFNKADDEKPSYVFPTTYTWEAVDTAVLKQITRVYQSLMNEANNATDVTVQAQPTPTTSNANPGSSNTTNTPAVDTQVEPSNENSAEVNDFDLAQLTRDMNAYRFRNIQKSGGNRGYYDFVCEIAGVYYGKDVVYLACFDGTRPSMCLRTNLPDVVPRDVDENLVARANIAGTLVYVCLYDNNMAAADDIMPGDIVWIVNAHVYFMKAINGYMVVMHKYHPENNPFNRQVTKMDASSVQYRAAKAVFTAAKTRLPSVVMPKPVDPVLHASTPREASPRLNAFTPPRVGLSPSSGGLVVGRSAEASMARRRIASVVPEVRVEAEIQSGTTPVAESTPDFASISLTDDVKADILPLNNERFQCSPIPFMPAVTALASLTNTSNSANIEAPSATTPNRNLKRTLARRPRSPFRGDPIIDSQMALETSTTIFTLAKTTETLITQSTVFEAEPIAKQPRNAFTPPTEPIVKITTTQSSPNASSIKAIAPSELSTSSSTKKTEDTPPTKTLTWNDLEEVQLLGSQTQ